MSDCHVGHQRWLLAYMRKPVKLTSAHHLGSCWAIMVAHAGPCVQEPDMTAHHMSTITVGLCVSALTTANELRKK